MRDAGMRQGMGMPGSPGALRGLTGAASRPAVASLGSSLFQLGNGRGTVRRETGTGAGRQGGSRHSQAPCQEAVGFDSGSATFYPSWEQGAEPGAAGAEPCKPLPDARQEGARGRRAATRGGPGSARSYGGSRRCPGRGGSAGAGRAARLGVRVVLLCHVLLQRGKRLHGPRAEGTATVWGQRDPLPVPVALWVSPTSGGLQGGAVPSRCAGCGAPVFPGQGKEAQSSSLSHSILLPGMAGLGSPAGTEPRSCSLPSEQAASECLAFSACPEQPSSAAPMCHASSSSSARGSSMSGCPVRPPATSPLAQLGTNPLCEHTQRTLQRRRSPSRLLILPRHPGPVNGGIVRSRGRCRERGHGWQHGARNPHVCLALESPCQPCPVWRAGDGHPCPHPPLAGCDGTSPSPADLDKLLSDLRSFLLILDQESLSAVARAKKKSVADLLSRLQTPLSEDAEYMIMRCLSPSPGTPQGRASPGTRTADATGGRACECRPASTLSLHGGSKVPGDSPSPPADDSYEDAEPLGPGRCTGSGGADTDSSHYESYGEDEDGVTDRAHYLRRPPAAGPDAEPPGRPEAQLCGFLWRKRWLGQWAKQLFIVREHVLLCFRCAADPQPVLELDLRGCRVTYKAKRGKKMPHALKVTGTAGEALVIGFQSRQQAEDWRKVIEEVSSDAPSGLAAIGVPASPSSRLGRAAGSQIGKEDEEEDCSRQSPARSPRPGEDAKGGFLAVRLRGRWQRLWCAVRQGALRMFPEPGGAQRPVCALRLEGCEVSPGTAASSPQRLRIRIAQRGRELALLQTHSDEEREAWLKTLRARGGGEPASNSPRTETPRLSDASSCPAAGGLLLRRVPTPNAYMDDPFGQLPPAEAPKHLYSNVERLQQLQQNLDRAAQGQCKRPVSALPTGACRNAPGSALPSQAASAAALRGRAASPQRAKVSPELQSRDLSRSQRTLTLPERKGARDGLDILIGKRAFPKLEEKVGQLERACRMKGRLKAGSEMNLLAIGKSLKGHIAATASSAGSEQGSFLTPLLKRTASAKSALKPSPSPVIVEKGKVLQKRKEWEMKSAM
ncbi:actin filament-associated protein 1-like isoform X3 [Calonectris borealis]|uniref:actin filament-associated protein 1-like isoform X3 n=1 Tax=Calonectris borealis TaxID=1323832 RepID=UPI003F4C412C